jgi:DNA-binding transcriptional LysR family regulator
VKLPQEFDLHALEVFVMTVELGGMSQCAAHLQVTQSAVSQTIAKLEIGIGAPLFDRTMRPLGLTASGKSLFARGQKLIAHARLAYDEVREAANLPISSVTVAMSFSLANQLRRQFCAIWDQGQTVGISVLVFRWSIRASFWRAILTCL